MFFKSKSVYKLQSQVIIMHELDSSSPWQNTAQFQRLPVESWGVGRSVSTGAALPALTPTFLHQRATYSGFTCCRRISDIRSTLACCVAQYDIGLTAVGMEKCSPAEYMFISVCSLQLYNATLNFRFLLISVFIFRFCGLVVRVSGYRYRGPGFDPRRYQIF